MAVTKANGVSFSKLVRNQFTKQQNVIEPKWKGKGDF